ncbi:MAG: hypothetical protein JOZ31_25435 [Verrucomicrobia bacterium]|nr:hypothetical protein [Verrucomicrobiota bacterium]MBV8486471.1 hypothetical protein [Verrucomicrobiota bacterium]
MNLRLITALFLAFGLLLTADLSVAQSAGDGQVQTGTDQVILTRWALQHIMARHWPDSTATGAGKFQAGTTEATLRDMINQAVRNGRARHNTHGRPGTIYEYDFQRQIGTTIDGGPASRLRVVVSNRNEVITAFPF